MDCSPSIAGKGEGGESVCVRLNCGKRGIDRPLQGNGTDELKDQYTPAVGVAARGAHQPKAHRRQHDQSMHIREAERYVLGFFFTLFSWQHGLCSKVRYDCARRGVVRANIRRGGGR